MTAGQLVLVVRPLGEVGRQRIQNAERGRRGLQSFLRLPKHLVDRRQPPVGAPGLQAEARVVAFLLQEPLIKGQRLVQQLAPHTVHAR